MKQSFKKFIVIAPFLLPHLLFSQTTFLEQIAVTEKKRVQNELC